MSVLARVSMQTRHLRTIRAVLPSSTLNRHGWKWVEDNTCDENYLDLAFLLGRGCTIAPQVGCVIVAGIEDGSSSRQQGEVLVSGINSFLVWDKQYGTNNGKRGRRKPDCHAEANAVGESAMHGTSLLNASCYVSKPPCLNCYTLLAASGLREIISPEPMPPRQEKNAAHLGIALRVVPCSKERMARRDALTALHVDRELVEASRAERKLTASERYAANLQRLAKSEPVPRSLR